MEAPSNELILKYKVESESLKQLLEVQEQVVSEQSLALEEKINELKRTVKRLNDEITIRQETEGFLKESERRFRDSLEKARLIVVQLDKNGKIIFCNDYLLQLTDYRRDEVLGRQWLDLFIPPAYRNEIQEVFKGLIEETRSQENAYYENVILTRAGEVRIVRWNNTLLRLPSGIPIGTSSIGEDVTERKKAEAELQTAYTKLKEMQAQLIQSAKMASIGNLAGGVAHEINNPLTGVLNNVQLIKMMSEQKVDFKMSEFKDLLSAIEESALRCKKITTALLECSHVSNKTFVLVSLNEVVQKVVALITQELRLQNIQLELNLEDCLPGIQADPQLMQQIFFDLISNAKWAIQKKSSKEEGGIITLKTEYDPENKRIKVSISDTGIGISKENFGKIFEPFFTTKAVGEGTGLGLSIVYNIIKQHNGAIDVESQVNKGTIFKIFLPSVS